MGATFQSPLVFSSEKNIAKVLTMTEPDQLDQQHQQDQLTVAVKHVKGKILS